jgi:hypothetical protein
MPSAWWLLWVEAPNEIQLATPKLVKLNKLFCSLSVPPFSKLATMSHTVFASLQVAMPMLMGLLEKTFPERFSDDAAYTLHYNAQKNTIGLNLVPTAGPASLFWLRENLKVQPTLGSFRYSLQQAEFDRRLQDILVDFMSTFHQLS